MNISLPLPCTILFCFGASLFFALTPWIAKVIRRKFSSTSEAKYPDSEIIKQNYRCIIVRNAAISSSFILFHSSNINLGYYCNNIACCFCTLYFTHTEWIF